jgi:competence protein ComFC
MISVSTLLGILAPYDCLSCGAEGSLLCTWCAVDAISPVPSSCFRCAKITKDFAVCGTCRSSIRLPRVWYSARYEDIAKKLITGLKFEQKRDSARIIAEFMHSKLPFSPETLIVPVPTARTRVRQRGFDHTRLIAKFLSNQSGQKMITALIRLGSTRQVGQPRNIRLKQTKGIFRVLKPDQIKGKNILLIDDVITTGSTLSEAASVLRKAGAKKVEAAVFAVSRSQ